MPKCLTHATVMCKMQRIMARTSPFPLYDKAIGGGLEQRLRDWRAGGKSYADISSELFALEIQVDPSTVRRWCQERGIPTPDRVA